MCGHGRKKTTKFDQAEFIDMGLLSRDSILNAAAGDVGRVSMCLLSWLVKMWAKRGPQ